MWSSIRPVEPALHCDHVTRKIRSCKPNNREKEGGRRLVRDKQRFAGHFGCGRAARHALCHTYHMQWVRPGEQLVNQSGALVFFNINHTEHTERGGGTKWDTVRSGQEQQQTRNCCHELSCLSSAELPSGFWGHYLTLISICNTCLARCRCPQLECYWWVTALTKHHHHSSYMERGGGGGSVSCTPLLAFLNCNWNGIKQCGILTSNTNQICYKKSTISISFLSLFLYSNSKSKSESCKFRYWMLLSKQIPIDMDGAHWQGVCVCVHIP